MQAESPWTIHCTGWTSLLNFSISMHDFVKCFLFFSFCQDSNGQYTIQITCRPLDVKTYQSHIYWSKSMSFSGSLSAEYLSFLWGIFFAAKAFSLAINMERCCWVPWDPGFPLFPHTQIMWRPTRLESQLTMYWDKEFWKCILWICLFHSNLGYSFVFSLEGWTTVFGTSKTQNAAHRSII